MKTMQNSKTLSKLTQTGDFEVLPNGRLETKKFVSFDPKRALVSLDNFSGGADWYRLYQVRVYKALSPLGNYVSHLITHESSWVGGVGHGSSPEPEEISYWEVESMSTKEVLNLAGAIASELGC